MHKILLSLTTLVLLIFMNSAIFAQYSYFDRLKAEDDSEFEEVIEWAWKGKFRPMVEMTSGKAMLKHLNFQGELPEDGLLEIKLGYSQIQEYEKILWELDERFIMGTYASDKQDNLFSLKAGDFSGDVRRFGFGNRLGYGYKLGPMALLLYNQNGLVWTELRTNRPENLSEEDIMILDRYEGVFRFGMVAEGGMKLQAWKTLAFTGSYELAVIYPRHIFWPWLGSYIILNMGMGAISAFADDIMSASPELGPIFYFLLKNGLAYGFYQGVKEKMNWPFNSETPMTMESFRVGISFTF